MKNLCGTCRFWGDADDIQKERQYRQCMEMFFDDGGSTGDLSHEPDINRYPAWHAEWAEARSHKAVVVDGSGYFAALRCREDFGCVLHQEKEGDGDTGPTD